MSLCVRSVFPGSVRPGFNNAARFRIISSDILTPTGTLSSLSSPSFDCLFGSEFTTLYATIVNRLDTRSRVFS
ncbi:hypothetical protein HBI56_022210 [Parastagonospora nodorum]|nr:hypothetical protein HBH56_175200 [Parastagonospora nodorum]KAH3926271.1 hypothetical protein HBH54_167960 [Parastagonospora nodorum]KAH3965606.1 hypothetical protein HBH52_204620 [Parastagonospora nodorum]KAH3971247.1 hypothetical protein HBH51_110330 [Parastagonospora nodorum]KAH4007972.1 hypothetical protein HBI10_009220 [Parastagonospora nodorum]